MYNTTEVEGGHCLECGSPVYGRPDKKFCCDSCRNKYHGHLRYRPVKTHNATLKILTRNYSILEALFRLKGASCPVSTLTQMGFQPDFVTHQVQKKGKHLEYRCFDFIYNMSDSKLFNLRRL